MQRARPIAHQLVRDREDRGIRSVVRLQAHDAGVLVGRLELEEEAGVGTGERVDRLARVADHADVAAVAPPQLQQAVLQRRDVLELVHREVPVLLVDGCRHVRLGLEHAGAREQHVLEVELSALVLELLVRALQVGDPAHLESPDALRARGGVLVDAAHRDLAPLDLARDVAQRRDVGLDAHPVGGMGEQPDFVVDDGGGGVAGDRRPEVVELRQRSGVERARRDALDAQSAQSSPHLTGRLRGEGHRHHPSRGVGARVDAVRDAMRDHARLARSGAGEHDDRTAKRRDRLELPFVEAVECAIAHAVLAYQSLISRCAIDAEPGSSRSPSPASPAPISARSNQRTARISSPSGFGRVVIGRDREEPEHEGARVRPRLRAAVLNVDRVHPGLLAHLADDRMFERLPRLDEPGEAREAVVRPQRVRAEQQPIGVPRAGDRDDHRRIGAREVLAPA